ncbi:MAG: flagellum-specific ATP synthase FliI, partial [Lachnospiraceae bacterium]|nr:flagellum-specific ATP synthase FliI [Lachnospiraceae bacterium]
MVNLQKYESLLEQTYYKKLGKVVNIVGLTIESAGPDARLADICRIYPEGRNGKSVMAEVVGFKDGRTILMPYENTGGIGGGCIVENQEIPLTVSVGGDMLGKVLDGFGRNVNPDAETGNIQYSVEAPPPDPMKREIINEVLPLGVKAVDGLITVGKGQRIGIFAGSGVGKSTLLGMFARNTQADINVIALIGERGREVREFIERDLG